MGEPGNGGGDLDQVWWSLLGKPGNRVKEGGESGNEGGESVNEGGDVGDSGREGGDLDLLRFKTDSSFVGDLT